MAIGTLKREKNSSHLHRSTDGLKIVIFSLHKLRVHEFVFRSCKLNLLYLFKLFSEATRALKPTSFKRNIEMKILMQSLGFCD